MEGQIHSIERLDQSAWDQLTSQASFFQSRYWADICARGMKSKSRAVFLCGYHEGELVAGMPGVIASKGPLRSFYSMPYGTYGGPVFKTGMDQDICSDFLRFISEYFRQNKFSEIQIVDSNNSLADARLLSFNKTEVFTHVIEINEGEHHPPDKKIEGHIRAGTKRGTLVSPIRDRSFINRYYKLYCLTEEKHGRRRPLYDVKFFEVVFDVLSSSSFLYWNAAEIDGEVIGSQINFIYGNSLFNWQTVSDPARMEFKPNQILMEDTIAEGLRRGVKFVNLGASPSSAGGLIDYKARWGGREMRYNIYTGRSRWRKLLRR